MKKVFTVFSFLICSLVFSQNLYWYDVMLEVDSKNVSTVAGLVDDFYSNHPKPSNVNVAFSSVALKGASEKATHMIGITSESSQSLADFRNSLKGDDWDLYISKMNNYVKSNSASAGRDLITNGSETSYPIGQAWIFKAKNMQLSSMVQAFGKLVKSYKFDGFVGMGQIVHGTENGESVYIYGTYSDLNSAFNFGPQNKNDAAAFAEFSKTLDTVEYSKSFTRVLIKSY
ncbi:hypothetical protein N9I27_04015 [Flavobacteriaceae bacterium]|nr:hypothetical protein [Flavobacteriaceae bacterium]MDA8849726.1 hypothetical protein [Flavobacteriaceae bacterium]MDB4063599.1 hypothetical protein [Flavobacteriaceae bacterium]